MRNAVLELVGCVGLFIAVWAFVFGIPLALGALVRLAGAN